MRHSFIGVAHRGDKANAPENTFPAFELAVEKKADAIEEMYKNVDGNWGFGFSRRDAETKRRRERKGRGILARRGRESARTWSFSSGVGGMELFDKRTWTRTDRQARRPFMGRGRPARCYANCGRFSRQ